MSDYKTKKPIGNLKNGLTEGSILAPILCNMYTNNQPIMETISHFQYA